MGEGDAGDVVERACVDRNAGEVVFAKLAEKGLEEHRLGDGENLRAWSHDVTDELVAEFNGGANQFPIGFFEDALFFAGFEKCFDVARGFFLGSGWLFGEGSDREQKADQEGDGKDDKEEQSDDPDQANDPEAAGALKEQEWDDLGAERDDKNDGEHGLGNFFQRGPGSEASSYTRSIEDNGAQFEGHEGDGEGNEDRGGERGAFATHPKARLNVLLPGIQVVLHFAGKNLAIFSVDAGHVSGNGDDASQKEEQAKRGNSHEATLRLPLRIAPRLVVPAVRWVLISTGTGFGVSTRSIRPWGRRSLLRRRASFLAISPPSAS